MPSAKKVKDLMIPLVDYPHIPYWFSVRQAIAMIKAAAADREVRIEPRFVLVFDEKYQLLGYLGFKEMLTGIEPRFLRRPEAAHMQGAKPLELDPLLGVLWEDLFGRGCKEEANKPVKEVMTPVKATVKADDPLVKAAYAMAQAGLEILPVMEEGKVVGIVRLDDIFKEITAAVLD
jgi:CBS-domain-containing membrane protein|uniref:CBS domain-containing protein n=1 Tax=Desulfobacca acetoxidans TaxID=60893 RepID=A0A7C3Z0Z2_9BACT